MKRLRRPSIIIVVLLIFFNKIDGNHKDTVIWEMLKKIISLYNPPKPYLISVIYGLSLQLQYGKLEKSLKCQKVWHDLRLNFFVSCLCIIEQ